MTTPRRTVLRDKATGLVGMGDLILEYDEAHSFQSWLQETSLDVEDSEDGFIEYCEGGWAEDDWEAFKETLADECEKRKFFEQLTHTDATDINWQHLSGSRDHRFSDIDDVIKAITMGRRDFSIRVYAYYNGLAFVVPSHDCVSKFFIVPVEDSACPKCDTVYEFDVEHAFIKKWEVCPECAKEDAWIMINGSPGPAQDYLAPFTRHKSRDLLIDYLYATQSLDAEEEEMAGFAWKSSEEEVETLMGLARDADKVAQTGWFETEDK